MMTVVKILFEQALQLFGLWLFFYVAQNDIQVFQLGYAELIFMDIAWVVCLYIVLTDAYIIIRDAFGWYNDNNLVYPRKF